jgi:hypothetical protein
MEKESLPEGFQSTGWLMPLYIRHETSDRRSVRELSKGSPGIGIDNATANLGTGLSLVAVAAHIPVAAALERFTC